MKVFDDLRQSRGYYYVDLIFNLNDLVILAVIFIFSFAFLVLLLLKPEMYEIIYTYILESIMMIPCISHFIFKLAKMTGMRRRIDRYVRHGKFYHAKIISEKKCQSIFNVQNGYFKDLMYLTDMDERFSWLPTVSFETSEEKTEVMTSKYALSNSYREVLNSTDVHIYVYKHDFVITNVRCAYEHDASIERRNMRINTVRDAEYERNTRKMTIIAFSIITVTVALRVLLKYIWI